MCILYVCAFFYFWSGIFFSFSFLTLQTHEVNIVDNCLGRRLYCLAVCLCVSLPVRPPNRHPYIQLSQD